MEVLDCVVTPEWAAALAGVSTGHLEAALARPDLWQEAALLERLLYKNANQHRGAQHFQRLQEVRRLLGLLRTAALHRRVAALHAVLDAAKQRGSLPAGSVLLAYGGDRRRVPSHGAAAAALRALLAACRLVEELGPAVHRASAQLLAQLAHSFFMPLCLTALAALARIQVLAGQLMLDAVRAYNTLAEAAAVLPPGPGSKGAAAAAASAAEDAELPQLLRSEWRGGLPQLQCVACAPGESLAAQAAAAAARYALQLVKPEPAGPATVLAEGSVPVPAPRHQPLRRGQQRRQTQQAPVLAVVEDRGVPISREAFAAAAAPAAAAELPAAAAAAADTDDEGGEAGSGEIGPAAPAAAAAAAPPASAAPLAAAEPAPLPLLAVVDDAVVERRLGRSGLVEVESLMEGESRGHLYRRTAAVLGQQPGACGRPAPAAAKAEPTAAKPQAVATAPAGQAAAAVPAAPAASAPAAASRAGPATHKPAFVAVGTQPAKPAFLSVAAPAAGSSAAASAVPPAAAEPAAAAAAAAAAPLALAAEAGRKRKKAPTAAAAAAAAAAAMQQQAAAAPKSWEDWLEPLGGGAAAGGAPPSSGPQPGRGQQGKRRRR